ncbi:MAG TPA: PepSY domain-containing protein [Steroidobacteraceae bacterium]
MRKLQRAILPAVLVPLFLSMGLAIAPPVAARSLPGTAQGGSSELRIERVEGMVHDGISLDEAVSRAERQYRARVVRTDVQDEDGRKVYVLKLLSEDGRVITVRIDAATGRMR